MSSSSGQAPGICCLAVRPVASTVAATWCTGSAALNLLYAWRDGELIYLVDFGAIVGLAVIVGAEV